MLFLPQTRGGRSVKLAFPGQSAKNSRGGSVATHEPPFSRLIPRPGALRSFREMFKMPQIPRPFVRGHSNFFFLSLSFC